MYVTALPGRLRQDLPERRLEAGMVVRHHELHPVQAAQAAHQRLLGPLVTLNSAVENALHDPAGPATPILPHESQAGDSRPVAQTAFRACALSSLKGVRHLGFSNLLHHHLQEIPKPVIPRQHRFPVSSNRRSFALGHGMHPSTGR